jgi:hypothetical protein
MFCDPLNKQQLIHSLPHSLQRIEDITFAPDQVGGGSTNKEGCREPGEVFNVVEVQDNNGLDVGYNSIVECE